VVEPLSLTVWQLQKVQRHFDTPMHWVLRNHICIQSQMYYVHAYKQHYIIMAKLEKLADVQQLQGAL